MSDGLLENIIQLEKQIQLEVAAERARAEAWQQREQAAIDRSFDSAMTAEELRSKQALVEIRAALQSEGAALEASSAAWCQRLSQLDEVTLREVLKRHLAAILPGGDHDHPDGQS